MEVRARIFTWILLLPFKARCYWVEKVIKEVVYLGLFDDSTTTPSLPLFGYPPNTQSKKVDALRLSTLII